MSVNVIIIMWATVGYTESATILGCITEKNQSVSRYIYWNILNMFQTDWHTFHSGVPLCQSGLRILNNILCASLSLSLSRLHANQLLVSPWLCSRAHATMKDHPVAALWDAQCVVSFISPKDHTAHSSPKQGQLPRNTAAILLQKRRSVYFSDIKCI